MSPCFCSCWNHGGGEAPHKKGALVDADSYYHHPNGTNRWALRDSPSRRASAAHNPQQHSSRGSGYIPWVWSRQFHEAYRLGPILGTGAFAVVHEATQLVHDSDDNDDNPQQPQSYAVKVLPRHRMTRHDLHHFRDEVHILLELRHPHVVRLRELYKTPDFFLVVMEKLDGGELFDRLCQKECYTEMEARGVCRTVLDAVAYVHARGVAHRDLKPENLLLASAASARGGNGGDDCLPDVVKVADFGFAKRVARPNSLLTRCGSPAFTAPEIVCGQPYDERCDNWSLGVLVYTLLGGYNPFQRDTVRATHQQIRQAAYRFDPEYWDGISRDAKRLIAGLLTRDPDRRLTAAQALQHPWMIGRGTDLRQNPVNLQQLKRFTAERRERQQKDVRSTSLYWLLTRR